MGKFEKDLVKFMDVHKNCDKSILIKNINQAIRNKGIYHRDKSRWVSEVTGTPIGTVYAWLQGQIAGNSIKSHLMRCV